jgi:methionyl aminopeptidase
VRTLDDGWTAVTEDGRLSAHFEHTVAITEDGAEVLSAPPGPVDGDDVDAPAEPAPLTPAA